ncbi:MAG: hypothetical protein EAX96_08345 [Candidatus Lokiarchaeota archaeon]|nr:hypothetical protein [Candidatus Lokiarchaeota archaeon]
MDNLTPEERNQLKKIIEGTGYIPSGLLEKPEIIKELRAKQSGPIQITLKDFSEEKFYIELVSVRKKDGFYGKSIEISIDYIKKLGEQVNYAPWVYQITDDKELIFPYYQGKSDLVIFSPIVILAHNLNYVQDKIDPYNASSSAFLLLYNPKMNKLFLEGVSRTIIGNVAIIENLMQKNNEAYDRAHHVKNWLYYFLFDGKKSTNLQVFSMRAEFSGKYKQYVMTLE